MYFPISQKREIKLQMTPGILSQISAVFVLHWGVVSPGYPDISHSTGISVTRAEIWYVWIKHTCLVACPAWPQSFWTQLMVSLFSSSDPWFPSLSHPFFVHLFIILSSLWSPLSILSSPPSLCRALSLLSSPLPSSPHLLYCMLMTQSSFLSSGCATVAKVSLLSVQCVPSSSQNNHSVLSPAFGSFRKWNVAFSDSFTKLWFWQID